MINFNNTINNIERKLSEKRDLSCGLSCGVLRLNLNFFFVLFPERRMA